MNMRDIQRVYLLGAGGIGMSALARYFLHMGKTVAGYDKTSTPLTRELEASGISMSYNEDIVHLPFDLVSKNFEGTLVIYTPAIPATHPQKVFLQQANCHLYKRAEVLGIICANHPTIAVAGTHGKTTTSTMIAHMLMHSGRNPVAFLGGISVNYGTNFLEGTPTSLFVVEADEYDRSFLKLFPQTGVITSVDPDHLDIYGAGEQLVDSFIAFANQVSNTLILKQGLALPEAIYSKATTYHTSLPADVRLENYVLRGDTYVFDVLVYGEHIRGIELGLPGFHNVENALAAIAVAHKHGLSSDEIKDSLSSFKGVKRRFEYIIRRADLIYIDDYAHHPEELNACIKSVKKIYPGKKVTGVFQPHLFSRTRDFMDGFANSLSLLDEVYLMDIYPARELPIEGITSDVLLNKISTPKKRLVKAGELTNLLHAEELDVLLTLGAGDIDQVVLPLKESLTIQTKHV